MATQQSVKCKGKTLFLYFSYNFGSVSGIRSSDERNRTTTLLHFTFSLCKGATSHLRAEAYEEREFLQPFSVSY